jgi:hypothetical protein
MAKIGFEVDNASDWQSATHRVPRSWNPYFEKTFGANVSEHFSWTEQWPTGQSVNYSDWL